MYHVVPEVMKSNTLFILQDLVNRAENVIKQLGLSQKERVYARALDVSLNMDGIFHRNEVDIPFMYNGQCVGHGRADLIIDNIIVEIKATSRIPKGAISQVAKYVNNLGRVEQRSFYGVVLHFCQATGRVVLYSDLRVPLAQMIPAKMVTKEIKGPVNEPRWDMYALRKSQQIAGHTRSQGGVVRSRFFHK